MIGYYVHHHGSGHLHRALALAPHLPGRVTGLSSLPRPPGWPGDWVDLPRDDQGAGGYGPDQDVTAGDRLHWVPLHDAGLRSRTSLMSAWIDRACPEAFVVDQSVEVCAVARLHGVPVIGLTAPGRRGDPPHRLGFDLCSALVGAWPQGCTEALLPGVDPQVTSRFDAIGAVSRFPVSAAREPSRGRPRVVLVAGAGGDSFTAAAVARAQQQTPGWDWTVLSRRLGTWQPDPAVALGGADVAIIHPGQNSLAEVAAMRVPVIVVPEHRPFGEQEVTATVLGSGWPAVVADVVPSDGWEDLLQHARTLDGRDWERWCDGGAPQRAAGVVARVVGGVGGR